ncbi:MAG: GIY-YIG nuclease family protein [Candidatus Zixiibacteriota bacterium]
MQKTYFVYVMANRSRMTYIGSTSDLNARVYQHKHGTTPGFTSKYRLNRLVYFESTTDARAMVARERELKGWRREKKVALIESLNPTWEDLSAGWYDD